ncbi:MAG: NYN domain-containing protein [Candidatus Woesebacteria bacterium]|nr:NYN domain-containing protein [Candidatus Woesebacteria bacterium]
MANWAFIDASNLFYGGVKSLGWSVDYNKLFKYLKSKYNISKVFYYAGVELSGFDYSVLIEKEIDLRKLLKYLISKNKTVDIQRVKFYLKLQKFGFNLVLKPVKIYKSNGKIEKKANCDVDLTFHLMKFKDKYKDVLILSGDGDFVIVLKYLQSIGKKVRVLARAERTAREIKQLVGGDFRDFVRLRNELEFKKK